MDYELHKCSIIMHHPVYCSLSNSLGRSLGLVNINKIYLFASIAIIKINLNQFLRFFLPAFVIR